MRQRLADTSPWQVSEQVATLSANSLRARVDLHRRSIGLDNIHLDTLALPGRLLEITPSSSLTVDELCEFYPRGVDLVGVYSVSRPKHSWLTAYWRAEIPLPGKSFPVGVSMLLSLQTELLDTHPAISVVSSLEAEQALLLEDDRFVAVDRERATEKQRTFPESGGLVLIRLPGGSLSYCEVVEASDQAALRVERHASTQVQVTWTLMEGFLEKGVIRRGRVAGVYLARQDDEVAARSWRDEFLARPVPLTT